VVRHSGVRGVVIHDPEKEAMAKCPTASRTGGHIIDEFD
jgi:hypothetical protein